jgi:hypothetical protein
MMRFLDALKPGDVILTVSYAKHYYWPPWKWPRALAIGSIKRHQKRRYPDCEHTDATHCRLYLDPLSIFDCTTPRAKWTHIADLKGEHVRLYRLHRTIRLNYWSEAEIELLREIAKPLIGKKYDYAELISHLIGEVLGYDNSATKWILKFWGMGRDSYVCSTAVRAILEKYRQINGGYERLFPELVELTAPATFECGDTPFRLIGEWPCAF